MQKHSSLRFLLAISSKGKFRLTIASLLVLASSILAIGPYYVSYRIIEDIINPPFDGKKLISYTSFAALSIVGQMLLSGIAMTQSHIAAYSILFDLRVTLAKKLKNIPLGYFSDTSAGVIKKIMMGNVETIEEFVAHNLVDLAAVVFFPTILFLWLCSFNWILAVLSVLPVIVAVALQRYRMRVEKDNIRKFFKVKSDMNTTIIDFVRGMPVIKAFNLSTSTFKKYKDQTEAYSRYWINMNKNAAAFFSIYALLIDCGVVLLMPVGGVMYLMGHVSLSAFLMFMFVGIGMTRFMKQLTSFGSNLTQIFKGVEEIRSILDVEELKDSGETTFPQNYDLEFRNVSFAYKKKKVINELSFRLKNGTITAIVGPSGAGKTTVARLIPRFWDVTDGEILISGTDVRTIQMDELMKQVSFVFQDVFMFNDSILENIRMGDPSISEAEVIEFAKKAQADGFIRKLKDQYQTILGADGVHLSGGEQQRIAIARAMAKASPIVILDEATSYADTENEHLIQSALNELLKDRTVVVIAHRLSTIRNADQILYMEDGSILESGRHRDLINMNGRYKQMWDLHMGAGHWALN